MLYPIFDANAGAFCSVRSTRADVTGFETARVVAVTDPVCRVLAEPQAQALFYEVIQLRAGVPVFWQDHMDRLQDTLSKAAEFTVDPEALRRDAGDLLRASGTDTGNLKLVLTADTQLIHFSETYYPTEQQFAEGVPTGILEWERVNPQVKQIFADYKAAVAAGFRRIGPHGRFYELLLQDGRGWLTEGSRSNLFFTRGRTVYSAPAALVLKGITRKYVLEAIRAAGAIIEERCLTLQEIRQGRADGAFLTASPIDVLPIASIEDFAFPVTAGSLVREIQAAYQQRIQADVTAARAAFE
jgi:branched-chain amino acid aminotransferase